MLWEKKNSLHQPLSHSDFIQLFIQHVFIELLLHKALFSGTVVLVMSKGHQLFTFIELVFSRGYTKQTNNQ